MGKPLLITVTQGPRLTTMVTPSNADSSCAREEKAPQNLASAFQCSDMEVTHITSAHNSLARKLDLWPHPTTSVFLQKRGEPDISEKKFEDSDLGDNTTCFIIQQFHSCIYM